MGGGTRYHIAKAVNKESNQTLLKCRKLELFNTILIFIVFCLRQTVHVKRKVIIVLYNCTACDCCLIRQNLQRAL